MKNGRARAPAVAAGTLSVLVGIALLGLPSAAVGQVGQFPPPPNDNLANATLLSGSSSLTSGTNEFATKETGEPNHAGDDGGASVWYRWTAPSSGVATIDTCDSNNPMQNPPIDTLLGVYTGSAAGALTEVDSNDDACDLQSRVSFQASGGTTYRIAVDGFNDGSGPDQGPFSLRISLAAPPPDPPPQPGPEPGDELPPAELGTPDGSNSSKLAQSGGIVEQKKIEVRKDPLQVRMAPDCPSGSSFKAEIGLTRLGGDGDQVGGGKPKDFRCRTGSATFIKSSGFFRIPTAWWKTARSAKGLVLLATIEQSGEEPVTEPLWFHSATKDPPATQRAFTGAGLSCSLFTNGGYMAIGVPSTFGYQDQPLQWHQVQAVAQTWTRGAYSPWYYSSTWSYRLNASGRILGNIAVVGGSLGVGGAPYLQWGGRNQFPVNGGSWAHMYLYIRTASTGWRGDYVLPDELLGAVRSAEWCGF